MVFTSDSQIICQLWHSMRGSYEIWGQIVYFIAITSLKHHFTKLRNEKKFIFQIILYMLKCYVQKLELLNLQLAPFLHKAKGIGELLSILRVDSSLHVIIMLVNMAEPLVYYFHAIMWSSWDFSFHVIPMHQTYSFLEQLQKWHFAHSELDVWA
jgi:hypothetical protein